MDEGKNDVLIKKKPKKKLKAMILVDTFKLGDYKISETGISNSKSQISFEKIYLKELIIHETEIISSIHTEIRYATLSGEKVVLKVVILFNLVYEHWNSKQS